MELKEIIIEPSLEITRTKLQNHIQGIPNGFTNSEYLDIVKSLKGKILQKFGLSLENSKIFATGHQPELFHPGILWKDILLAKFAYSEGAIPVHFVVDTDVSELIYFSIQKENSKYSVRKIEFVDKEKKIFYKTDLSDKEKILLVQTLELQEKNLQEILPQDRKTKIISTFEYYKNEILNGVPVFQANENLRKKYLQEFNLNIFSISLSELVQFPEFQIFVEKISSNKENFIKIYNQSLERYRKEHKIKNQAQPLPNLEDSELPFWKLNEDGTREKIQTISPSDIILPRAITLTIFLRLFACDLFIHGRGGGRYDEVSDFILQEYFGTKAAPNLIASVTMHLTPPDFIDTKISDEKDLQKKLRDLQHSPEKFLSPDHDFVLQKKNLQTKFSDPNFDKKQLHSEISRLNEEMHLELVNLKLEIENELTELPAKISSLQVFQERHFPFFYYSIKDLLEGI